MTTVTELQRAILGLSETEYTELRAADRCPLDIGKYERHAEWEADRRSVVY